MARIKRKNRRKRLGGLPVWVNYSAKGPRSYSVRLLGWSWNSSQRRHRFGLGDWWKVESEVPRNLFGVRDRAVTADETRTN